MKGKIFISLIACLLLVIGSVDAQYGNTKKKKKKKSPAKTERSTTDSATDKSKEEGALSERIWYGLNIQNIGFFNRTFSLGLAPHVGYKVIKNLSVGAMVKLDYYYEKGQFGGSVDYKFSALDLGPTVFTRYKIGEQFFAQVEYERAFFQRPKDGQIILDEGKVITERVGENYLYVGAGYGGGYPFGTYISLHYNLLDELKSSRIPFDYRFGIVYNF